MIDGSLQEASGYTYTVRFCGYTSAVVLWKSRDILWIYFHRENCASGAQYVLPIRGHVRVALRGHVVLPLGGRVV